MLSWTKKLIVLLVLIGLSTSAYSQFGRRQTPRRSSFLKQSKHYMGITMAGGYSAMASYKPELLSAHGGGGSFGFLYEFKHGNFLLQTGLNINFVQTTNFLGDYEDGRRTFDTQETEYYLKYYFKDRKDRLNETNLQIPILFGGNYNRFYFMGGVKLNVNLRSRSLMTANATTIGMYDRYFDPFTDMPNHGLVTQMNIDDRKEGFGVPFDALLSFEVGYSHNLKILLTAKKTGYIKSLENIVRIAAYIDYGLVNHFREGRYNDLYMIHNNYPMNLDAIQMPHIYTTKNNLGAFVNNINAGVKLTFLINTVYGKCHWYPCAKPRNTWYKRRR